MRGGTEIAAGMKESCVDTIVLLLLVRVISGVGVLTLSVFVKTLP